jgi:phosphoribosylglycinamide formyltransferase-1
LASGGGSILAAILDAGLEVTVVVVDRPCKAMGVAEAAGVAVEMVERSSFGREFDRVGYSERVVGVLKDWGVKVVAMAGFGTVLAKPFFDVFSGRVLNTHPALLPAFKGWHAVADALEAGVKVTGCTVHIATEEVDSGPILAQEVVAVEPGDDEASLHERIKSVERRLYPETLRLFLKEIAE